MLSSPEPSSGRSQQTSGSCWARFSAEEDELQSCQRLRVPGPALQMGCSSKSNGAGSSWWIKKPNQMETVIPGNITAMNSTGRNPKTAAEEHK